MYYTILIIRNPHIERQKLLRPLYEALNVGDSHLNLETPGVRRRRGQQRVQHAVAIAIEGVGYRV